MNVSDIIKNNLNEKERLERKIKRIEDQNSRYQKILDKYPNSILLESKVIFCSSLEHLADKVTIKYFGRSYKDYIKVHSYHLDNDLKIISATYDLINFKYTPPYYRTQNNSNANKALYNLSILNYSEFFNKTNCKNKLIKKTEKLISNWLIQKSNHSNITFNDDCYNKEKFQGLLLFK
jgi:hypothetical protein